MVSTGNPALVREILATDPEAFEAFGVELLAPVLGRESLLMLSGDRHRAARKLLSPPFHGARLHTYGLAIQAATRDQARSWIPGRVFSMQECTQAISLRVILEAVFGLTDPVERGRYQAALLSTIAALNPSLMFVKALQHEFGGIGPWARLQRRLRALEAIFYADLAARRASSVARDDILSLIMAAQYDDGTQMTDRQLLETMMTLVVAGHETSAIATAWACYFLFRHPAVHERLMAELATAPHATPVELARLPFLEAVCHETLRLHPIAGTFARTLARPITLGEWQLPKGIAVGVSVTALHRRPELYPDPEVFRPERFRERSFAPYEYAPFGGGHRRCIGAAFALYEMKLVLATLLERPLALASKQPIGAKPRSTIIGAAKPIRFVALS